MFTLSQCYVFTTKTVSNHPQSFWHVWGWRLQGGQMRRCPVEDRIVSAAWWNDSGGIYTHVFLVYTRVRVLASWPGCMFTMCAYPLVHLCKTCARHSYKIRAWSGHGLSSRSSSPGPGTCCHKQWTNQKSCEFHTTPETAVEWHVGGVAESLFLLLWEAGHVSHS